MIDMPVKLMSSVAFAGPNLNRLFVTTIADGIHGDVVEGAGALYVIDGLGGDCPNTNTPAESKFAHERNKA